MEIGKIFASAGCGKTTALLNLLDTKLTEGAEPRKVLFTTFTRSGAYEARDRAISKFPHFGDNDFPYFRTLHSICYRAIVAPPIMTRRDYMSLGKIMHMRFGTAGLTEELYDRGKGDALLGLYNLQRNLMQGVNLVPEEYGIRCSQEEYDYFIRTYDNYRNERGVYDYTDLLEEIWSDGLKGEFNGLPITHAFIDEAQDLTRLQYEVVKVLVKQASVVWYAGDDDQCIFAYSGADPEILVGMEAAEQIVLEKSYRLPVAVASYANKIANRIQIRQHKHIQSFNQEKNDINRVSFVNSTDNLDRDIFEGEKSTTILCRNRVFFGIFELYLQERGYLYSFVKAVAQEEKLDSSDMTQVRRAILTWKTMLDDPDQEFGIWPLQIMAQFMPNVLWRAKDKRPIFKGDENKTYSYNQLVQHHGLMGQECWQHTLTDISFDLKQYMCTLDEMGKLANEPNIKLGTIHSFKGKEDDNIILLPDMSWQTWQSYNDHPDSEHRVFYVGVTRAKEQLILLNPITKYHYEW